MWKCLKSALLLMASTVAKPSQVDYEKKFPQFPEFVTTVIIFQINLVLLNTTQCSFSKLWSPGYALG